MRVGGHIAPITTSGFIKDTNSGRSVDPPYLHDQIVDASIGDDMSEQSIEIDRETIAGIPIAQLKELIDRQAIIDCLRRYARGLDRHDVELESSAFWPDAQVNYGPFSAQRDEFVIHGNEGHEDRYDVHQHHITTQSVDIDGDTAHAETYVIYMLRTKVARGPIGNIQHVGSGRYIDVLERREGEWRIVLREFLPEMRFAVSSSQLAERPDPPGPSRWDRNDISYKRPLQPRPQD